MSWGVWRRAAADEGRTLRLYQTGPTFSATSDTAGPLG